MEMLILCTKNVIFSFNDELYYQIRRSCDGIGAWSSNCQYIYGIIRKGNFTYIKETYMMPWKRYG